MSQFFLRVGGQSQRRTHSRASNNAVRCLFSSSPDTNCLVNSNNNKHNDQGYPSSSFSRPKMLSPVPSTTRIAHSSKTNNRISAQKHNFSTEALTQNDNDITTQKDGKTTRVYRESDFFGEPVTFLMTQQQAQDEGNHESSKTFERHFGLYADAMKTYDDMLLCIISKGKTATGGTDDFGLESKASHSFGIMYASLLEHAVNDANDSTPRKFNIGKQFPMFTVAALSPLLAQTGVPYVQYLDNVIFPKAKIDNLRLFELAEQTISLLSSSSKKDLSLRETHHIQALQYLTMGKYNIALRTYQHLLHLCPGDSLALSIALDLCNLLGDTQTPKRLSGSVSSYWEERSFRGALSINKISYGNDSGNLERQSRKQAALGSSLVSLGFSIGDSNIGVGALAEQLAERTRNMEQVPLLNRTSSGISAAALSHTYYKNGRVSEGISLLHNFDGVQMYDGCGFLFFDSKLQGLGARMALDRDGHGADGAALRVYESYFDPIITRLLVSKKDGKIQALFRRTLNKSSKKEGGDSSNVASPTSFFESLFGSTTSPKTNDKNENNNGKEKIENQTPPSQSSKAPQQEPFELDDIFSYLPPTPQIIIDATLLLLRLTLSGAISTNDERWVSVRTTWKFLLSDIYSSGYSMEYYPLLHVLSHLFLQDQNPQEILSSSNSSTTKTEACKGLQILGQLMQLGIDSDSSATNASKKNSEKWKQVVHHLSGALEGRSTPNITHEISLEQYGWEIDTRLIWDHCFIYAVLQIDPSDASKGDSKEIEEEMQMYYSLAKSVCSENIAMRPNCPEAWWRYSLLLEKIGDEVASENARSASISLACGDGRTKELF